MIFATGRAVPLAALALVLAGCSGSDETAVGPAATAATSAASTPASAAPTTPSPLPCQQTAAWSQTQTVNWVRAMTQTDSPGNVVLGKNTAVASVCKGVPIQVEFWNVVLTSFGGSVSYTMHSAQRKQVSIDGRRTVTVKTPKDFVARDCGGTLTAVYVGKPLTEAELPTTLEDAMVGGTVEFQTDRVAFSEARMPASGDDLRRCHPNA
jgi:hypothetical protein